MLLSSRLLMFVTLGLIQFFNPLHAGVLFRDDFRSGFDLTKWDYMHDPSEAMASYEWPTGSTNQALLGIAPAYSAKTGIICKQTFTRGNNLRCTFRWWYNPATGNIDFSAINGPWRRTGAASWGTYTYPIAQDLEAGIGRYIQRNGGTENHDWAEGNADWQPGLNFDTAFNNAIFNATSRDKSILIRIQLGNAAGSKGWYSTDNGHTWLTINLPNGTPIDTTGMAAGSTYAPAGAGGSVTVSGNSTVYLGFGVRGAAHQWWDDIVVENSNDNPFSIVGLPQHDYFLNTTYANGTVIPVTVAGTQAVVIVPNGPIDPERRWILFANIFLLLNVPTGTNRVLSYYAEAALAAGYYVVGIDVGTSCGSPAGAEVMHQFYQYLRATYDVNPRARLFGQSNGGLIVYGYAFRHPDCVDRIFGLFPATDLRSWPNLLHAVWYPPAGLYYPLDPFSEATMNSRLVEFNPVDNLAPLAQEHVRLMHVHGDNDLIVPHTPNTLEVYNRYTALGGTMTKIIIPGGDHGSDRMEFYRNPQVRDFLLGNEPHVPVELSGLNVE